MIVRTVVYVLSFVAFALVRRFGIGDGSSTAAEGSGIGTGGGGTLKGRKVLDSSSMSRVKCCCWVGWASRCIVSASLVEARWRNFTGRAVAMEDSAACCDDAFSRLLMAAETV